MNKPSKKRNRLVKRRCPCARWASLGKQDIAKSRRNFSLNLSTERTTRRLSHLLSRLRLPCLLRIITLIPAHLTGGQLSLKKLARKILQRVNLSELRTNYLDRRE